MVSDLLEDSRERQPEESQNAGDGNRFDHPCP